MLNIKIDLNNNTGIIDFTCPFCGSKDIHIFTMPKNCWYCGKLYLFDIKDLVNNQEDRYQYYKRGEVKTS